jgi:hypothetical protein
MTRRNRNRPSTGSETFAFPIQDLSVILNGKLMQQSAPARSG